MALRHIPIALLLSSPLLAQHTPVVPSPMSGSTRVDVTRVDGPLEVRSATADSEAILAGLSYSRQRYAASPAILVDSFVRTYRDALFAAGWKLIDVPKVEGVPAPEGVINIAAQFMNSGRNVYTRISRSPDGRYEINVADVGEEDWSGILARACRVRIHSLHFDLDRPTLRLFESTPTLEKLANLLKARSAPVVVIEGHADNIGDSGVAARQALSEARAKSVADWLIGHGVPAAKISATGYGKQRPIAENDTDLGRALNRRIEVACSGQ
ncbi:MAG TPA: OmpA family protein [Vicinamibacterales bacterium]|nr:OmpA family protein [Vicinamibacterales bacterium]